MWICKVSESAVVSAGAGAAELVGGGRSQGSSRIAMGVCMVEIDCMMENGKLYILATFLG